MLSLYLVIHCILIWYSFTVIVLLYYKNGMFCLKLWNISIAPLSNNVNSVALKHGPCLLGSHTVTCHHTFYTVKCRATPATFITAIFNNSHYLVASHFTDPERMVEACVNASNLRVPCSGVEPGPLTSEASECYHSAMSIPCVLSAAYRL